MKKILIALVFTGFFLAASACSPDTPAAIRADTDRMPKINLDVASITVLDQSGPQPAGSPYNAGHFQPTIAAAIRQWAAAHLAATGVSGQATVVIRDASLTSQGMAHEQDMFTRNQASKYVAHAAVEIDVSGREGQGQVSAEASRFQTLPEKPNPFEKQKAYTNVLNGLMHDLAANLQTGINEHLGDFIITAPPMDRPAEAPASRTIP